MHRIRISPARALVLSFAGMIALGTGVLMLPGMTLEGKELAWHEALFRATSAVCVTGLVVRSPEDFTAMGQLVTAVMFQLGGLGILTFGLILVALLGRKVSIFGRQVARGTLGQGPWEELWPLFRGVLALTLITESVGTVLLAMAWWEEMGPGKALLWGAYHAVSAFCNAGFGLHPDSLVPWIDNMLIVGTVLVLLVVGGLGFVPLTELYWRAKQGRRRPLSLHSKLVLAVTGTLLVLGWLGLCATEWSLPNKIGAGPRLLALLFQAATPRTAGFSTMDIASYSAPALLLTIALMFVGASPGSTGGGIKTTTVGVLASALLSRARGRSAPVAFKRSIPSDVLASAVTLALSGLVLIWVATMAIMVFESAWGSLGGPSHFLEVLFEVTSAFATVGLSCGITAKLTVPSRMVLIVLMFVGRVGPLTFGLALTSRRSKPPVRYAEEGVMVG